MTSVIPFPSKNRSKKKQSPQRSDTRVSPQHGGVLVLKSSPPLPSVPAHPLHSRSATLVDAAEVMSRLPVSIVSGDWIAVRSTPDISKPQIPEDCSLSIVVRSGFTISCRRQSAQGSRDCSPPTPVQELCHLRLSGTRSWSEAIWLAAWATTLDLAWLPCLQFNPQMVSSGNQKIIKTCKWYNQLNFFVSGQITTSLPPTCKWVFTIFHFYFLK